MTTKHMNNDDQNQNSGKGFASMDDDKQREIASKGGKAAHEKRTAHEFDSDEAAEGGSRGGQSRSASNNSSRTSGSNYDDESGATSGSGSKSGSGSHSSRGGSSEQHAEAGRQSHKNK